MNLNVFEIFPSISGEIGMVPQGTIVTFVRLAGCNLKCKWCDTKSSQNPKSGTPMDIESVCRFVRSYNHKNVVITGGEPLLQYKALSVLCKKLKQKDFKIMVETNGTIQPHIADVDFWTIDYKLDYSDKMVTFLNYAKVKGAVKIVVTNFEEFKRATKIFDIIDSINDIYVEYDSPMFAVSAGGEPRLEDRALLSWILDNKSTGIILNTQLHKLINAK